MAVRKKSQSYGRTVRDLHTEFFHFETNGASDPDASLASANIESVTRLTDNASAALYYRVRFAYPLPTGQIVADEWKIVQEGADQLCVDRHTGLAPAGGSAAEPGREIDLVAKVRSTGASNNSIAGGRRVQGTIHFDVGKV